jgi:prepilin-type N-terminal cleavage/methylation domain-containing protein
MILNIAKAIKRAGRDKRGFTLVELMAVLAVLAIISAIAVPRFTGTIKAAKEGADESSALIIARAAEQKWIDDGETGSKTYHKDDLVPDYVKEIDWQNSSYNDVEAVLDGNGNCTSVKYYDGSQAQGDNLLP